MEEKMSIIAGAGVAVLVIVLVIFYMLGSSSHNISDILLILIPIMLVVGVITILRDRIRNFRAGLPSDDERAKKLHWKAGAYSYYVTIWVAIGTMWYNIIFADNLGFPELTAGQVVATIVLISAMFWFLFQFYFTRQGDIE